MFSPFIKKPFEQARQAGLIPADLSTISGTWGAVHDTGEMTYMNLVHLAECDGTDPTDLTHFEMEGRRQAMLAIEALRETARKLLAKGTPADEVAELTELPLAEVEGLTE